MGSPGRLPTDETVFTWLLDLINFGFPFFIYGLEYHIRP